MHRSTSDDRSRRVTLYGFQRDLRWWLRPGPVPPDVHARLSARAKALCQARANRGTSNTPLIFVCGFMAVMLVYYEVAPHSYLLATTLAGLGIGATTALVMYRTSKDSAVAAQLIAAFLEERRCPSCGAVLDPAPGEDDGCTVCPRCGAAWRLQPNA